MILTVDHVHKLSAVKSMCVLAETKFDHLDYVLDYDTEITMSHSPKACSLNFHYYENVSLRSSMQHQQNCHQRSALSSQGL